MKPVLTEGKHVLFCDFYFFMGNFLMLFVNKKYLLLKFVYSIDKLCCNFGKTLQTIKHIFMPSFLVQALKESVMVQRCSIEYVKILLVLLVCLPSGTGSVRLSVPDLPIRSTCTSGMLSLMMVSMNHHHILIICS